MEENYKSRTADLDGRLKKGCPKGSMPSVHDKEEYQKWLASGSKGWQALMKVKQDIIAEESALRHDMLFQFYDNHFQTIGEEPEAILASGIFEVDNYIRTQLNAYDKRINTGRDERGRDIVSFMGTDIRATKDGYYFLDRAETERRLHFAVVSRHLRKLLASDDEAAHMAYDKLEKHIQKALAENPRISDTQGELYGSVHIGASAMAVRATQSALTHDKISTLLFSKDSDPDKTLMRIPGRDESLYPVSLDTKKENMAAVLVSDVAVDYSEAQGQEIELSLPAKARLVHDAVVAQWHAGNTVLSYEMIYRAMTGKTAAYSIKIPDTIIRLIDDGLRVLRGKLIKIEYKNTVRGQEHIFQEEGYILAFDKRTEIINGQVISKAIRILGEPMLLKWARYNSFQIDVRDITLLDVPGLNSTSDNLILKMYLYRAVVQMRRQYDRQAERLKKKDPPKELENKDRSIRLDTLYTEVFSLDYSQSTRKQRHDIKAQIDKCLTYWQTRGLFDHYEYRKDKLNDNCIYAIYISFVSRGGLQ